MIRLWHEIAFLGAIVVISSSIHRSIFHIRPTAVAPDPPMPRRRLADASPSSWSVRTALDKANRTSPTTTTNDPFRILFVVTSLVEYDKGTRGTTRGADRLRNVLLPLLSDSVSSMTSRGWVVDVYLVLGYGGLRPERKDLIVDALPEGVGLEVWEDAIPYHYPKTFGRGPKPDQSVEPGDHALSRQHRFVVKDKLPYYDFFVCFEDDMRITADHVLNFLELSSDIEYLRESAESSPDDRVHVRGASNRDPSTRDKPHDGAPVGNDVVDDPLTTEQLRRVFPGFLRVEVLDRNPGHPLRQVNDESGVGGGGPLEKHKFVREVPPDADSIASDMLDPKVCCRVDPPGRGKMDDVVMWETNIQASGVRKFPDPLGWAGVMPVEDRADVGSYWSGFGGVFGDDNVKRPRRIDATIGNQAGFMATRSQIEYFHETACPGGFLPPFVDQHWKGDSLQRHSVEFWSGGFQLFGQCFFNRILSLDPAKFERQLLYHVSNNKQRTIRTEKFIKAKDFLAQLHTVRKRAESSLHAQALK